MDKILMVVSVTLGIIGVVFATIGITSSNGVLIFVGAIILILSIGQIKRNKQKIKINR